jgi:hypothetical protein
VVPLSKRGEPYTDRRTKVHKKTADDDPLLQVPPASRGNRRGWFPSRSGGNLKEGGIVNFDCAVGIKEGGIVNSTCTVGLAQQGVFESGDTLGDLLAVFALARGFGDIVQQRDICPLPLLVERTEPLLGVGGQVRVNRARLEP